jgi:ATP-dependent DNA helicase PIF1
LHSAFRIDPSFDYSLADLAAASTELPANQFFKKFVPKLIIIDEISMVSNRLLAHVHSKCGGHTEGRPFGGAQLILFGDFMQLPPVIGAKKNIDCEPSFTWRGQLVYSGFAFEGELWREARFSVERLTTIVRQADQVFAGALAELRYGRVSAETARLLLTNVKLRAFKDYVNRCAGALEVIPTVLHGTNASVENVNTFHFNQLKTPVFTINGSFTWSQNGRLITAVPNQQQTEKTFAETVGVPKSFKIRVGAQILYRVNNKQVIINIFKHTHTRNSLSLSLSFHLSMVRVVSSSK